MKDCLQLLKQLQQPGADDDDVTNYLTDVERWP